MAMKTSPDYSRRLFLGGLVSAVPAVKAATGEAYWQMVRQQFPFPEERVPMNAANLCPSPRIVSDRVIEVTRDIDTDCSFQNRAKYKESLEESRKKIANQLGVSDDEIALVRNTSEANNTINNGLALKPGDEVVIWDQNHPTNNVAWDVRASRYGIVVRRASTPASPSGTDELLDAFQKLLTNRTRVLAVTHVSNLTGIRLPVRELCEVAHRRGIYVHVDGAQSWGALDVNLQKLGCDSYSASAHKWFCGPKEAGILYVKADRVPEIWPNTVAPGWGDDAAPDVVGARKFESLGQRDDACLAAVGTAADFLQTIGPARVEARVLELAATLKDRIVEAGLKLLTPQDAELSGGVCIIDSASEGRQQAWTRLYREHGIAGATTGGLRLCPHTYNTMDHIDRAARGVRELRHLLV
jgi:selenocysteine lyase/cysteine desulfurase